MQVLNCSWVCETHSPVIQPSIMFNSPTLLCYLQLPGCKRQTGENKTAGSSLLYTGWKKFRRRVCDNSFQDSHSGYLGVSMLDLTPDLAFQKRIGSNNNCIPCFSDCYCPRTHFSIVEKFHRNPKKKSACM